MNPGWRSNYLRYKSYFLNTIARYRERADIQAYLEILLSLATISVFSIFALRPTLITIASLIKELDSKRQTLEKMDKKIQDLSHAKNIFEEQKSKIALLSQAVDEKPNPDTFARQIAGLSTKYQIPVSAMSIGEGVILGKATQAPEASGELASLPEEVPGLKFSVNVNSAIEQYTSLSNFLSDFLNLRYSTKIDSLRIEKSQQQEKKSLLMIIEGRLPYFK